MAIIILTNFQYAQTIHKVYFSSDCSSVAQTERDLFHPEIRPNLDTLSDSKIPKNSRHLRLIRTDNYGVQITLLFIIE